jgi:hypothetical protein
MMIILLVILIPSMLLAVLLVAPAWFFGRRRIQWGWADYGQLLLLPPIEFLLAGLASFFDNRVVLGLTHQYPIELALGLYGFILLTVIAQPWTRLGFALLGWEGRAAAGLRWLLNLSFAATFSWAVPMHLILGYMFAGM